MTRTSPVNIVLITDFNEVNLGQLYPCIQSIVDNFDKDFKILIVNYRNLDIPTKLLTFVNRLTNKQFDIEFINKDLISNEFFYSDKFCSLTIPYVMEHIVENYPPPYLSIDPDIICFNAPFDINDTDVYLYENPVSDESSDLQVIFSDILKEPVVTSFDAFYAYSKNKDFFREWKTVSTEVYNIGLEYKNGNEEDNVIGDILLYTGIEFSLELIRARGRFNIINGRDLKLCDAPNPVLRDDFKEYGIFHYDFEKYLKAMNTKYTLLFNIYNESKVDESNNKHRPSDVILKLYKERNE